MQTGAVVSSVVCGAVAVILVILVSLSGFLGFLARSFEFFLSLGLNLCNVLFELVEYLIDFLAALCCSEVFFDTVKIALNLSCFFGIVVTHFYILYYFVGITNCHLTVKYAESVRTAACSNEHQE